ncbi:MAG: cytochrome c3 family protein [Pirellulaceae bacterium]
MNESRTAGHWTCRLALRRQQLGCVVLVVVAMAIRPFAADASTGVVQIPDDVNTCVLCHSTPELFTGDKIRFFIPQDFLAGDVHDQKGIKCHECHGGNPTSLDAKVAHPSTPRSEMTRACGACHEDRYAELTRGVHSAVFFGEDGTGKPLTCRTCHRDPAHHMRPVRDLVSPVRSRNQVAVCAECHERALESYEMSGHGRGVFHSGLISSAVCADCHSAHAILPATDTTSTLHKANVAETCARCHRFIKERLSRSVHGRGNGPGNEAQKAAPGGVVTKRPTCTDCHQGHDLPDPKAAQARLGQPDRCGNCHGDLNQAYGMSMHGELTQLGYAEGAKCSDCHGAHDILPLSDPDSLMAVGNRGQTCGACHINISPNLLAFDPHANHYDRQRSPAVYWAYYGVLTFIIVVFGFFGLHAVLWFLRGSLDVLLHGRPRRLAPHTRGYVRFRPFHRVAHTIMVVSFLGLALTGLPLKFSSQPWASWLASSLGGCESIGLWHRIFSISMFGCFFAYLFFLLGKYFVLRKQGRLRRITLFGPDSPLPNLRDARDFGAMVRWFACLGPRPTFERWAYWEKFDFFGAASDTMLLGVTGLILWFPNVFCSFLPGEAVNIAKVIHSTLALLATGFVFAIHFFATHLRPDKFPMDMSILTGIVSEEELRHERPEYLERLRSEGRIEEFEATTPPRENLWRTQALGFAALLIGLATLAAIVWSLLVQSNLFLLP